MGPRILVFLVVALSQGCTIPAMTDEADFTALKALKDIWKNVPPTWVGADPCGSRWEGILCANSRVTSITLASMGLKGSLSGDIQSLSELQILDLSYNKGLSGPLPSAIGDLKKLTNLILVGCSFWGPIPDSIGSLPLLASLSLNSNGFTGSIPSSIGNLTSLYWLDLADNRLTGTIPVSTATTPGLDLLVHTKHFHLGLNQLSGTIPPKLFSSEMKLIHVLFESNKLTGSIPSTLGLVKTLEVVRLDNNSFRGPVPSNINSLTSVSTMFLSNNDLTGPLPNLTGMNALTYLDMRNNSFDDTEFPPWLSTLQSLKTLLADNPICQETAVTKSYCTVSQPNSSYATPPNNCVPASCFPKQHSSPNCKCAFPYTGLLGFRAPSFSDLGNITYFSVLEKSLMNSFKSHQFPVDSVHLSQPRKDLSQYLDLNLQVFPFGQDRFNRTAILSIGFMLSNQTFKPPAQFGPFFFIGDTYLHFTGEVRGSKKSSSTGAIIGAAAGGSVLLLLLLGAGLYAFGQKMKAEKAIQQNNPFAHWESNNGVGGVPQLKGARCFSFEEIKKYTNNFSETNDIGSGEYGKVYRGVLPTGELITIKRALREWMQPGLEFKTEIELLSRVHHRNVVSLVGFCLERGEQMLIYKFVSNGSLMESLSAGKTGIRLDWMRRLKVALGAARGLAYLHELANPPIIHRHIKSTNILLDESLNAKVADFGLSKLMGDSEKGRVTTQGYLDPEYYMTLQLTEKSDVYSFGVVMLELLTGRRPVERGKYVVREVKMALDRAKDLYNLRELLDPSIGLDTTLKGLDKFVDVALKCVQENGSDRPTMGEVVNEIENILQLAGLNPNADSASTSASYDDVSKGSAKHPYKNSKDSFEYSEGFPDPKVEPL
ncbi:leucine-rich repeat receptor protein kinase HPCA1 isoform X1 [Populus trichocarpa]|uniref:leucine-rich repeat receptor protein kinase HPCA1 isoform X1 n=1 Tax=Populus trichocarpa TaxID=3694 RepID=UPI0022796BFF|nr:leucine-rich repeat receptor protein kinase HPCA1 isoform X1 [Populus trichocarpa]